MKKRALCLLIDGFEEIETITPVDLMRRAGIDVTVVSLNGSLQVQGRSAIIITADRLLEETDGAADFDLLLIPGGPGVNALREDGRAAVLAREFHRDGKILAAICAAPLVLHDAGLLGGVTFTAHHSTRDALPAAIDSRAVVDNRIITSRGAGTSLDFSMAILAALLGPDAATEVAHAIMA